MPSCPQFSRVDTVELKSQILRKLGRQKAEKYFYNLKRLLNLKLSKTDFEIFCYNTFGKENLSLHNVLIKSILGNACLSHGPPSKQTATGHSRNTKASDGNFGNMFALSPQKGRSVNSRDRRFIDRPSPLGTHGKVPSGNAPEVTNSCCDLQRSRGQQSAPELISIGRKAFLEVGSVEDGEEVEQMRVSPGVQSRCPITAPLGLSFGSLPRKALQNGSSSIFSLSKPNIPDTCSRSFELPDTRTLRKRLEGKLEQEGLGLSVDCVNLLNHGLDTFLKRLIRPCIELARSRCTSDRIPQANGNFNGGMNGSMNGVSHGEHVQRSSQGFSASLHDFQVAMGLNPQFLGGNWPVQLEKICSYIE